MPFAALAISFLNFIKARPLAFFPPKYSVSVLLIAGVIPALRRSAAADWDAFPLLNGLPPFYELF
jgi:hypothetical protein